MKKGDSNTSTISKGTVGINSKEIKPKEPRLLSKHSQKYQNSESQYTSHYGDYYKRDNGLRVNTFFFYVTNNNSFLIAQ